MATKRNTPEGDRLDVLVALVEDTIPSTEIAQARSGGVLAAEVRGDAHPPWNRPCLPKRARKPDGTNLIRRFAPSPAGEEGEWKQRPEWRARWRSRAEPQFGR